MVSTISGPTRASYTHERGECERHKNGHLIAMRKLWCEWDEPNVKREHAKSLNWCSLDEEEKLVVRKIAFGIDKAINQTFHPHPPPFAPFTQTFLRPVDVIEDGKKSLNRKE